MLERKEKARQEKIEKARRVNERAAAARAKKGTAVDVSGVRDGGYVEVKSDPTTKAAARTQCATCGGTDRLEEDRDAIGVYYCTPCWEKWEG